MARSSRKPHKKDRISNTKYLLRILSLTILILSVVTLLLSWSVVQNTSNIDKDADVAVARATISKNIGNEISTDESGELTKSNEKETPNNPHELTKVVLPENILNDKLNHQIEGIVNARARQPPSPKSNNLDAIKISKNEQNEKSTKNSNAKPLPAQKPPVKKRYLTYRRTGGRLNNQIIQFIGSLQHAKVLNRTLLVPDETNAVQWTGMLDPALRIWDLSSLNEAYDIDWESGLLSNANTNNLSPLEAPEQCQLSNNQRKSLLEGGPGLWKKWDEECPDIIDLGEYLPFCETPHQFCGNHDEQAEAHKIYSYIKLSPTMSNFLPSKQIPEYHSKGYDQLAIHSRRAGEGGYDWEICINKNKNICLRHLPGIDRQDDGEEMSKIQSHFCNERTMRGNCAVWLDLSYQIKSKRFRKNNEDEYRFVLASDGTHDWNIDFKDQFITANSTAWIAAVDDLALETKNNGTSLEEILGVSDFVRQRLRQSGINGMHGIMFQLSSTLLEMFSLVDSNYFLGGYFSTFSLNVCFFRGLQKKHDSNMCWMLIHPESEHAIPSSDDEIEISTTEVAGQSDLPPALMSDVEHAFVLSNDGKFVAIDRYRFQYQKPGQRKAPTYISVLGDGVLPITFEKGDNGEEVIHSNLTCSMGNQLDTLATIRLIKGNKSYKEHYFSNGNLVESPFSTEDGFRTVLIVCEELIFDNDISIQPPLIIKSSGEVFLSLGSSLVRPRNVPRMKDAPSNIVATNELKLVHCLAPVHGIKDPRWLSEYLEYHRAIGVSHVYIYNVDLHSPDVQSVLQEYRDQGLVTRHDWSHKASRGYTHSSYGHALWAAQTDCVLRTRGIVDYAFFSDIYEIPIGNTNGLPAWQMSPAVKSCEEARTNKGKVGCAFNSKTVTSVYRELNEERQRDTQENLLLERYNKIELKPHCPNNCECLNDECDKITRKFHFGRQKYMANVRDLSIPPFPMWTHAIARDYDVMEEVMEIIPDDVLELRRYKGDWYLQNNLLESTVEVDAHLPKAMMNPIRLAIKQNDVLNSAYNNAKGAKGLEWIAPQ